MAVTEICQQTFIRLPTHALDDDPSVCGTDHGCHDTPLQCRAVNLYSPLPGKIPRLCAEDKTQHACWQRVSGASRLQHRRYLCRGGRLSSHNSSGTEADSSLASRKKRC